MCCVALLCYSLFLEGRITHWGKAFSLSGNSMLNKFLLQKSTQNYPENIFEKLGYALFLEGIAHWGESFKWVRRFWQWGFIKCQKLHTRIRLEIEFVDILFWKINWSAPMCTAEAEERTKRTPNSHKMAAIVKWMITLLSYMQSRLLKLLGILDPGDVCLCRFIYKNSFCISLHISLS